MKATRKLKTLKVTDHALHKALKRVAVELELPLEDVVTALLREAIKNGPKAVQRVMRRAAREAEGSTGTSQERRPPAA